MHTIGSRHPIQACTQTQTHTHTLACATHLWRRVIKLNWLTNGFLLRDAATPHRSSISCRALNAHWERERARRELAENDDDDDNDSNGQRQRRRGIETSNTAINYPKVMRFVNALCRAYDCVSVYRATVLAAGSHGSPAELGCVFEDVAARLYRALVLAWHVVRHVWCGTCAMFTWRWELTNTLGRRCRRHTPRSMLCRCVRALCGHKNVYGMWSACSAQLCRLVVCYIFPKTKCS